MIATITAALLCATIGADSTPNLPADHHVCVEIGVTAARMGVSQRLAIAVGYRETQWRRGLVSSADCHGPMQVKPYHCPLGRVRKCPLIATGVRVLADNLRDNFDGALRLEFVTRALCEYATGQPYGECQYARDVLGYAARGLVAGGSV